MRRTSRTWNLSRILLAFGVAAVFVCAAGLQGSRGIASGESIVSSGIGAKAANSLRFGRLQVYNPLRQPLRRQNMRMLAVEQAERPAELAAAPPSDVPSGPFLKPDGSPVTLEDCIGNFDSAIEHPWLEQGPDLAAKWDNVDPTIFKDDTIQSLDENVDYLEIFGSEPDIDPEQLEVANLIDSVDLSGTRKQWAPAEVKDGPTVTEENMPDLYAQGCLDVMIGVDPDVDPELQALFAEMDARGGLTFQSETGEDPAPPQEGEPGDLLSLLFTDPDADPEVDELKALCDQKNPLTEIPDFTPLPPPKPIESEQIVILRADQIDDNGMVIDPVVLAGDPALVERQQELKTKAARKKPGRLEQAQAEIAASMTPEMEAEMKAKVEKEAAAREEARNRRLEAEAAAKAQAEAEAKAQALAAKQMEKERIAKQEMAAAAAKEAEAAAAAEPQGYKPPVVAGMPTLDDVALETEMDEDYAPLREFLRTGEFRQADDWTRQQLINIAGEGAKTRGWVYFAEVPRLPYKDLKTIDDLWRAGSGGKFGYSRQREILARNAGNLMKMYAEMDWVTKGQDKPCPGCDTLCPTCVTFNYRSWKNDEFIYDVDAEDGHLPLTSTLRGTKLLLNLLNHPAIVDGSRAGRNRLVSV